MISIVADLLSRKVFGSTAKETYHLTILNQSVPSSKGGIFLLFSDRREEDRIRRSPTAPGPVRVDHFEADIAHVQFDVVGVERHQAEQ